MKYTAEKTKTQIDTMKTTFWTRIGFALVFSITSISIKVTNRLICNVIAWR